MDYGQVLKFSFAWLFKKESLKYALIKWAVSLFFLLLLVGTFWLLFGNLIKGFLSNPTTFLYGIILNPQTFLMQLIPLILLFVAFFIILAIVEYFVDLYISVLFYFYAFRSADIRYAAFPLGRLSKLFMLTFAIAFLVFFSWIHRKAWLIPLALFVAVLLLPLMLLNPMLIIIPAAIIFCAALAMIVYPIYLFLNKEQNPNVVTINRNFLLFVPILIILLVLSALMPLLLLLAVLLFIIYIIIIIYNGIRAIFSDVIFLERGSPILESIKVSLDLTNGRTGETFAALLISGIAGWIFFLIIGLIGELIVGYTLLQAIPENLWGISDMLQSLLAAVPAAYASGSMSAIAVLRQQIVEFLAGNILGLIIAPFGALFYSFLIVGIYQNLVSGSIEETEKKPKK